MKPIYLMLHALTVAFPLIRSFEPRVKYAKKWIALFPAIFITATAFIIWDVIFTRNEVWGFNDQYLIGYNILDLPLEEWLFFITVPFASVFIYECVFVFTKIRSTPFIRTFSTVIGLSLVLLAVYNAERAYTFWAFCLTGVFLSIISSSNPRWLGKFWLAYGLHLIPFFLVNGILTGSFLEAPIVWYNDNQNLGIRLLTIPIEDSIYALLLLLMNVSFFQYFKKHFIQTKH